MKKWIAASAALTAGAVVVARASTRRDAALEEVFSDNDFQITGVTVSPDGRIFVNYPRWSDLYLNAVVEVLPGGIARPYPDSEWNGWDRKPHTAADHFVCVQSVVADDEGSLWVLDPAAPMLTSPVPHGPKLVQIDLASNQVSQVIRFGPDVIRDDCTSTTCESIAAPARDTSLTAARAASLSSTLQPDVRDGPWMGTRPSWRRTASRS